MYLVVFAVTLVVAKVCKGCLQVTYRVEAAMGAGLGLAVRTDEIRPFFFDRSCGLGL